MTTHTSRTNTRGALAALSLPVLMASLDTSIANTALPTLADAFSASFPAVQWIVLAYLLAITTLIVSAGRLGDVVGRRRLLLAGIALFTIASLACGAASGLAMLLVARAAQGLGAAIMMALSLAFVGDTVSRERTGSAMGLLGTMSAIGTAFGPSLGGLLVAALGWRWLFLVNVPVGLLNLLLASRHLPADRPAPAGGRALLDPLGTVLLAGTLASYALAMTLEHGRLGPLTLGLLLAAAAGAGMFVLAESRVPAPLVRLEMFRDNVLGASLASGALVSAVMMSTLVVGPFYLARALALPPALVGVLLSVGPLVVALAGVPAGRLADRIGTRRTARAGLLAMALGAIALSQLPVRLGAAGYVLAISVVTAGYALFQTSNNTSVMTRVAAGDRGALSGLLNLSRNLGLITGASLMGAVFAFGAGSGEITSAAPAAIAAGMRATVAAAAGLMVVALAVSAACERPTPPP
ncbi:MAG: MFS transporter [Candidatus Eisenbacteria bacterium]|nr:MFS transporter [Candidatus Eisenbacteria bacterium]